jgi:SAM-dependent methyltransferase
MLQDDERTSSLQAMVAALVRPGDVVADIGTGTGVLALWARRAGAARVYAIDTSDIIHLSRQVAADNGVDGIVFLQGDAAEVVLPEQVDVVLSECLGNFAFGDAMFGPLAAFAQRWLKESGRRGPTSVRLFLQPGDSSLFWDPLPFWQKPWQGLDLSAFGRAEENRVAVVDTVASFLWAEPLQVLDFDPYDRPDSALLRGTWSIDEGRLVTGVVGWFEVDWAPGVTMDTSPRAEATHWSQVLFPIPHRRAAAGERLEFQLSVEFSGDAPHYRWSGCWLDADGAPLDRFSRDARALFAVSDSAQ